MFRNVFLGFTLSFLLNSLSSGYWISDLRTAKQLNATGDIVDEGNETSFIQNSIENSTADPELSDTLFWTVPDMNETAEDDMTLQMDDQDNQDDQELILEETNDKIEALEELENDKSNVKDDAFIVTNPTEEAHLDEKIVLQRTNCHLEILIQSTNDLKIQIMFAQLQNNTSGECCITLSGPEDSLLAIFISNIHLYQNGYDREVLQVITSNHGSAYVLKEYHNHSTYHPLLLTETHTVHLVLHYKVTSVFPKENESYFNLEVLTYQRNGNYGQNGITGYSAFSSKENQNLDKFFY